MTQHAAEPAADHAPDAEAVRALYQRLLESWNQRDAEAFAACIEDEGYVVGFDGSPMLGRAAVAEELSRIFADHPTARYVSKVRDVRLLTRDVVVLSAVAGMVPPGQADLNPAANTMQTVVATKHGDAWQIALFQNTPAQLHGRPAMSQALTDELRQLL